MLVLGVLVSGSGTNLQAVLDAINVGRLAARVAVVISNKADAGAIDRAKKAGVATVVIDHKAHADRASFDAALVTTLREHEVDLVVLAGFMRIVTNVLLDAFPMRVINIHPALLPAFPGVDAQKQAIAYGARISGCTVHFVDTGTDTGPIIVQRAVPVLPGDDEESLKERILAAEHAVLPAVLQWFADGRVHLEPPAKKGERARVVIDAETRTNDPSRDGEV